MKVNIKNLVGLVLLVMILVALGAEAGAQNAEWITGSGTNAYNCTLEVLPMGQERLQMNYKSMGVIIADNKEDPLHNSSLHCLGALHAVKGDYNNSGFCVATRPDGDQIFSIYNSTGKLGQPARGTSAIVGGTGKMKGIQGGSEYTEFFTRAAAEGTAQIYNKWNGRCKLP